MKQNYGDIENVEFVKNYDGDTITVNIPNVSALFGENISIRIAGIDTPEKKGQCDQEKDLAQLAKERTFRLLTDAKEISLRNTKRGKYFRIVADVFADGTNVADDLINHELAVPYDGGTKITD